MRPVRGTGIRVVLADPQAGQRDRVRRLLGEQPDIRVVGEAAEVVEALQQVRASDADVLILDLAAPGDGIALIERLSRELPRTRVLVVTLLDTPALLDAALTAGGRGYILKTTATGDLIEAIRAVFLGRTFVKVTPAVCAP